MPKELQTRPRAQLVELAFDKDRGSYKKEGGRTVEVQFNPESLKVTYNNQKSGNDQQGTSGVQYVGKGSTSLSVDLFFDVTRPGEESPPEDVRYLTDEINMFMRRLEEGQKKGEYIPPGVRFVWGSFLFEGVMESMNETLEFFDPEGRPLRATVSITLSQQEIQFARNEMSGRQSSSGQGDQTAGAGGGTGGDPEDQPPGAENTRGTSVQQLAAEQGRQEEWKAIAEQNDIENPRAIHNPNAVSF